MICDGVPDTVDAPASPVSVTVMLYVPVEAWAAAGFAARRGRRKLRCDVQRMDDWRIVLWQICQRDAAHHR